MGVGVLIARKPVFETLIEGGTGTNSASMAQPDELPERLESGTINVPGILGVEAGVQYVRSIGMEKIYRHEFLLTEMLYQQLAAMPNIILYTASPRPRLTAPVLSFNVSGHSSGEVADYLSKNGIAVRAGLHCAPSAHRQIHTEQSGTVRVSTAVFNRPQDISALISTLKKFKK